MTLDSLINPLLGGILIGFAATLMMLLDGKVLGVSGIVGGIFDHKLPDRPWRWAFVFGLLSAGIGIQWLHPEVFTAGPAHTCLLVIGGLLVGFGTRLGNGCTSGHGVCGISRFSRRSIFATLTFMVSAALTVWLIYGKGV